MLTFPLEGQPGVLAPPSVKFLKHHLPSWHQALPLHHLQSGPQSSSCPNTGMQTACPPLCPDGPVSPGSLFEANFCSLFLPLAELGPSGSTQCLHWIMWDLLSMQRTDSLVVGHRLGCPDRDGTHVL